MKYHSYNSIDFLCIPPSCLKGNGDTKWKEFDNIVQTFMVEQGVPGASVAICRNQEIIYKQGYGSAGASKRVNPDSLFRIASISKPITAFLIFNLCADYEVGLDSNVFGKKGILKSYKYKDKRVPSITIRHLLQHSAGWDRDIAGDLAFVRPAVVVRCHPESVEHNHALLAYTLTKRLQFKPGTRHAYSNLCYLVLGLVIERISGHCFSSYLTTVLERWNLSGIQVGGPWRAEWASTEVEYFNNREPQIAPSLHADFGEVVPQYGGISMASAAAYGGLIANCTSLLQFVNLIENLTLEKSGIEIYDSKNSLEILSAVSNLLKESLRKPDYESGCDWYGLGWDVQDKGKSWGHTGGMEGTSSILFHHISGLSWVLLLNAWARDIDLNGVMKCAISRVSNVKLFDCDLVSVDELDGFREYNCDSEAYDSGRVLFSKDRSQVIALGLKEKQAHMVTSLLKVKGYLLTWINVFQNELGLSFTSSCSENYNCSNTSVGKDGLNSYSEKLKYILIFSFRDKFEDFEIILNKSKNEITSLINEKESVGYIVDFIDSFSDSGSNLRFSAVLIKFDRYNSHLHERSLHLQIKAEAYVRHIKSWVKSQHILCQTVSEEAGELFVSVLLENKKSIAHNENVTSSYWVQIEPESFLTELNRKIKQNMTLTYAKFFNADGESWVSGCWTNSHTIPFTTTTTTNIYHRISMSKYGLFPELADAAAENIRLLSVSEYEDDGVVYYAGLWIANQ